MTIVLGCGTAGLVHVFYHSDSIAYGGKILGELSYKYILGPRLLQSDEKGVMRSFIEDFLSKYNLKEKYTIYPKVARIGYEYQDGTIKEFADESFKKKYVQRTRNKKEYEKSYLSDSQSIISHYVLKSVESGEEINDSFSFIFKEIAERETNRIIEKNVKSIDLEQCRIIFDDDKEITYDSLVSTIPLNIFRDISKANINFDFELLNKNFIICDLSSDEDKKLSEKYSYVYSVGNRYTRKTYQKYYVVYEAIKDFEKKIEGNSIIDKVSLKLQIKDSFSMSSYKNILFLGRYAQWNHGIRLHNVIERAKQI